MPKALDKTQISKSKKPNKNEMNEQLYFRLAKVVEGYKVRRILKNNKTVCQLKKEYIDLLRFAHELKNEYLEQK